MTTRHLSGVVPQTKRPSRLLTMLISEQWPTDLLVLSELRILISENSEKIFSYSLIPNEEKGDVPFRGY